MWLIYFTIGGNSEYAQLLEECIKSIHENCKDNSLFDIFVMCDTNYVKNIDHLGTKIHITSTNLDGVQSSMRKIEIFDIPNIQTYEAVLYLDCDIMVCGDITDILSKIVAKGVLYTLIDSFAETIQNPHEDIFFGLEDYDESELAYLKNNIPVFNCGQFAFIPNVTMQKHFSSVRQLVVTHKGSFFYEQSFMNRHFNLNCCQDHEVFGQLGLLYPSIYVPGKVVVHFANAYKDSQKKLFEMQSYYQIFKNNISI